MIGVIISIALKAGFSKCSSQWSRL